MGSRRGRTGRRVGAARPRPRGSRILPSALRSLFWDLDASRLAWDRDRDLIVARVLAAGGWAEARLVRRRLGDDALREWVIRNEARGLSPARVRFWALVLDLPGALADGWVRAARATVWEGRHPR